MIEPYKDKHGNTVFKVDIYLGKKRVRRFGIPTRPLAKQIVASLETDYLRGEYKFKTDVADITITDLSKAIEKKLVAMGRSLSTIKQYKRVLNAFIKIYPGKKEGDEANKDKPPRGIKIQQITSGHINDFYAKRLASTKKGGAATLKQSTAVDDVLFLMASLRQARKLFPELKNWAIPEREPLSKQDAHRNRVITKEEEQKIITALMDPQWRCNDEQQRTERHNVAHIFWLALRTGMRVGEILALKKSTVIFNPSRQYPNGHIVVRASHSNPRTKTGEKRTLGMSASIATMLRSKAEKADPYLFPSSKREGKPVQHIMSTFEKACIRAGIIFGRDIEGGLVFHDARHTYATRALQFNVDIKTLGKLLGHSDEFMTMRYLHATTESEERAVSKMDDGNFSAPETTVQILSNSERILDDSGELEQDEKS